MAGVAGLAAYSGGAPPPRSRSIELNEAVKVAIPKGAREVRLWIPKPPSGGPQSTELLGVDSPLPYAVTSEPEFGNQTVFLRVRRPIGRTLEVRLRYRIARKLEEAFPDDKEPSAAYRIPRGLLALDDAIREIARKQTQGMTDPVEKGRALYQYVLKRMAYDKSGQGWGRGDSIYACRVGKGNCTDFHSLFMALAMASGIPARFRMGLSLPEAPEGALSDYHCWAEFYAKGSWIPVDISEAWKNPRRAEYYFGHLDVNRVLLSTGRDIRLSPPQKGPPLNFFHRPYAEADGKPLYDIEFVRSYRDNGRRA
ncbi:MAG: hypothetical protein A2X40_08520 [Elusimicrobia bacterium GWC2_65_9]|nr:MAG: hypothetical protein A2X37_01240 [Elusimicrobia bacterium GWA2_66_18]OGR76004.1 MAG: hypothetical protein A2X40_08520 [Elusimicrobia bacterium GWC2_65_9]